MAHDLKISARAKKLPAKTQNTFQIQGGSKLEVFDNDGKLIHKGEFKSFTSNFLKLLYGSMVGAGTAKAKDLSNTDIEMNAYPQLEMKIVGGLGLKKFGVVVGTSDMVVSVGDYNISVPSGLTLGVTIVGASTVGSDSVSVEISRQISNTTGTSISLKEAGLICGYEAETDNNVLIARDLFDFIIENGKKTVFRYTVNFNFDANGGFVKFFADNMFNNVFSKSGAKWAEIAMVSPTWSARRSFGCVIFHGKMWVIGGAPNNNEVWCSEDGNNWSQVTTSSTMWDGRGGFGCCVYDDKIWVIGGNRSGSLQRDVWYSTDGANWTLRTQDASFGSLAPNGCLNFHGKMWLLGGIYSPGYDTNAVYYSSDGYTWTIASTTNPKWSGREDAACCVYDDKMWIIGGMHQGNLLKDVWYSSNGTDWTQATSTPPWSPRYGCRAEVFNGKMWITGGAYGKNDVWYSTDGVNWTQATSEAEWKKRYNHAFCAYENKMWVMGGVDNTNTTLSDVWGSIVIIVDIKVGTHNAADTPFSATATALGAEIADGSESGQLIYGTMPAPETTEPSTIGNKTTFSIAREFTNSSGADIIIKEVGLFSGSSMLARLILAQPVTIANGGSEIITVDFETEV